MNPDVMSPESVGPDLSTLFILNEQGHRGEWQAVLAQDEALIQIPITRSYAEHALYLRAKARARASENNEDLSKAMELIERSYLLAPSLVKLELRAELADRLGDGGRVVNSIWQETQIKIFSRN